jgi:hypothetical protein
LNAVGHVALTKVLRQYERGQLARCDWLDHLALQKIEQVETLHAITNEYQMSANEFHNQMSVK